MPGVFLLIRFNLLFNHPEVLASFLGIYTNNVHACGQVLNVIPIEMEQQFSRNRLGGTLHQYPSAQVAQAQFYLLA